MASEKGFMRMMEALKALENIEAAATSTIDIKGWTQKCYDALCDDFNSPVLIAHLFEAVKWIFALYDKKEQITAEDLETFRTQLHRFVYDVLGLQDVEDTGHHKLDATLQILIQLRNQARKAKNWELSDQIRDRLQEEGIELKDGRDGTTYIIS